MLPNMRFYTAVHKPHFLLGDPDCGLLAAFTTHFSYYRCHVREPRVTYHVFVYVEKCSRSRSERDGHDYAPLSSFSESKSFSIGSGVE